jgi:hypothetical protein
MADHFRFYVNWSDEDQEYIGTCQEFPGLSHLDVDKSKALSGIVNLVLGVLNDMSREGSLAEFLASIKEHKE